MDAYHFHYHNAPRKPERKKSFKSDRLGETWGSLYRSDFHEHNGKGIWNRPRSWHGIRNMFSFKPRLPHQCYPPKYFDSPYFCGSKSWSTDYRANIGNFTFTEGLRMKRPPMDRDKMGDGEGSLPKLGSSADWTTDYRDGPGRRKTRRDMIEGKRSPPAHLKPNLPPPNERIHPHWAERVNNPYVRGHTAEYNRRKGPVASDYMDGSGFRDENRIYLSTRQSKNEYRHIRGRDLYCGKPLVGY